MHTHSINAKQFTSYPLLLNHGSQLSRQSRINNTWCISSDFLPYPWDWRKGWLNSDTLSTRFINAWNDTMGPKCLLRPGRNTLTTNCTQRTQMRIMQRLDQGNRGRSSILIVPTRLERTMGYLENSTSDGDTSSHIDGNSALVSKMNVTHLRMFTI